jgi:hypothetical protein
MIELLPDEQGDGLMSRPWAFSKPTVLRVEHADRDVGTSRRDARARNWDVQCVETGITISYDGQFTTVDRYVRIGATSYI